ncbi:MAG: phenylalanine--tRNA ligase subunit beta, partial [Bacteroidia bacterium]|nr:phenylalanine--tRNA ligase subunit beta [Bacteroidia bacterium]
DEKERKLSAEDLMICDSKEGICIAGVYGGLHSGVSAATKNIFLESACFDAVSIRKTSFRHGLRTDAAARFEKGTDVSATVNVLKRAALLIKEICGGEITSDIIDVYPQPNEKTQVAIKYHYLKKISGKNYHPDAVKDILGSLGFEIVKEGIDELRVAVPYYKPDISLPADLVEEVLRIDGLDSIVIPEAITITPSVEENYAEETLKEKVSNYLVGLGFSEILTNSITNASYFSEAEQQKMVKMLNNLSADLNILRNSLFETSLECVAYNLNRKNLSLKFFEFGKAYSTSGPGEYNEAEKLSIVISGNKNENSWKEKAVSSDFYYLKGVVSSILNLLGIKPDSIEALPVAKLDDHIVFKLNQTGGPAGGQIIAGAGEAGKKSLEKFDIKQPVFFAGLNWALLSELSSKQKPAIKEIPKYPAVQRDIAMIVDKQLQYEKIEKIVQQIKLEKLREIKLFDTFESEKLGVDKKSMAINFTFLDEEKTLTDKEIDEWMNKIMETLENGLNAKIRKQ